MYQVTKTANSMRILRCARPRVLRQEVKNVNAVAKVLENMVAVIRNLPGENTSTSVVGVNLQHVISAHPICIGGGIACRTPVITLTVLASIATGLSRVLGDSGVVLSLFAAGIRTAPSSRCTRHLPSSRRIPAREHWMRRDCQVRGAGWRIRSPVDN